MSHFMESLTEYTHNQARSDANANFDVGVSYQAISARIESTFQYSEDISRNHLRHHLPELENLKDSATT